MELCTRKIVFKCRKKTKNINKRIAQNTMLLYLRLIIVMGVSLFTVRIVLKALGVVDYGIHNVVAGIVTMFSFITMTLSTGTVRFFSFQLGEKNIDKLNKLFNLSSPLFLCYHCGCIYNFRNSGDMVRGE